MIPLVILPLVPQSTARSCSSNSTTDLATTSSPAKTRLMVSNGCSTSASLPPKTHNNLTARMVWTTTGRLGIALHSGGGRISRRLWFASSCLLRFPAQNVYWCLVSVYSRTYHETERVQEAFPRADA